MNMKKNNENEGFMTKKTIVAIAVISCCVIGFFTWGVVDRFTRTANADPVDEVITETIAVITEPTTMTSTETTTTTTTSITTTEMTTTETTTTVVETTTEEVVEQNDENNNDEEQNNEPQSQQQVEQVITKPETTPQQTTTVATTTYVETTTEYVEETEPEVVEEESANEVYLGNFRITGYIADPGAKTASGTIPCSTRTIAMNKTQFKNLGLSYGDKIRVEGIGTFILEDCGCKSGRIDIFRDSEAACYALTPYADAYLVKE
jgi:hypothetical protein